MHRVGQFEELGLLLPATFEMRFVLSSAVAKFSTPVTQEAWFLALKLITLNFTLHVTP
jgi:hypothetical protein